MVGVFDLEKDNSDFKNRPIHVECSMYKNALASTMGGELAACFVNCKKRVPIRHTLADMGYPQGPTPVEIDNSPAEGFINET